TAQLVANQRIVDDAQSRRNCQAGHRFVVVMLPGPSQWMNMREHRSHAEIRKFGLSLRPRVIHQFFFPFDPSSAQEYVGMELAMLYLVPDLARAHPLKIDIARLLVNGNGENLC